MVNKIVMITDNDLDGAMCAALARIANVNDSDIFVKFVDSDKDADKFTNIVIDNGYVLDAQAFYITDVSINIETAEKIRCTRMKNDRLLSSITILRDHHQQSAHLNNKLYSTWSNVSLENSDTDIYETCASTLFFDALKEKLSSLLSHDQYNELYDLVYKVRDYDTWKWFQTQNMEPVRLNLLCRYVLTPETFSKTIATAVINGELRHVLSYYNPGINAMQKFMFNEIDRHEKKAMENLTGFEGYTAASVYAEIFKSEIGNYICKRNENVDIAMVNDDKKISLRTNKIGLKLPELAKKYGGGGRGMSASIPIDKDFKLYKYSFDIEPSEKEVKVPRLMGTERFVNDEPKEKTKKEEERWSISEEELNGVEEDVFDDLSEMDEAINNVPLKETSNEEPVTEYPEINYELEARKQKEIEEANLAEVKEIIENSNRIDKEETQEVTSVSEELEEVPITKHANNTTNNKNNTIRVSNNRNNNRNNNKKKFTPAKPSGR